MDQLVSALLYQAGERWLLHRCYPERDDAIRAYRTLVTAYPQLTFSVVPVDARMLGVQAVRLEEPHANPR